MRTLLILLLVSVAVARSVEKPNIIFILSDDLAMGDLGCYGQKLIKTPHLDRMAREGTRYTQAYCGTSVCAPSRASLMTGLHSGHCPIRANWELAPGEGQQPLPAGTVTVAQILKGAGYATACMGKWGMGMFDTTGNPLQNGFDHFYGYNCQRHAHSYFPTYLYNDDRRFELPGNDGTNVGKTYAQELIQRDVERWVRAQKHKPFFLYYAITLPHGRHAIDDLGEYAQQDWTPQQKAYAAQVTRLDADVGRLLALLKELQLDEKTLVMLAGDNGSSFGPNTEMGRRFDQSMGGALRGFKRGMYEGALRQAALARWPGTVPASRVSDEPWAFWDFLPTVTELAGAKLPDGFKPDGFSLVAYLKGGPAPQRDYFYWEVHERASIQAVRLGDWKAVKNGPDQPVELYDLKTDTAEKNDLAAEKPELVARARALMTEAHVDIPEWPMVANQKQRIEARRGGAEHRLDPRTPEGLRELFHRTGEPLPMVSAHRGGPMKGFPENCLATFSNTLRHTFSLLEIDPRYTKDGEIVLFHDPTLERTSTGQGRVADQTLVELRRLRLKDTEGNVTSHGMPTLAETLEWARGRTILVLDQKDVPVTVRVKKITEHKAEGFAMVIVNTFKDAQAAYALNTNVMMEVMIPNRAKFAEFDGLGVPWRNVVAFVGHTPPEDRELYEMIHRKGANCMIGTSRHLDLRFIKEKMDSLEPLEREYRAFLERGADLIETDIPVHLGPLLFQKTPVPPARRQYFRRR
jgi:arylsulfatase A